MTASSCSTCRTGVYVWRFTSFPTSSEPGISRCAGALPLGSLVCELLLTGRTQVGPAADGDAVLAAAALLELHPRALAGGRVQRHDVAQVDRRVLLNPAALGVALIRADVLPHAVDPFDDDAVLVRQDPQDAAGLALVRAGDHDDRVTRFNVSSHNCVRCQLSVVSCEGPA